TPSVSCSNGNSNKPGSASTGGRRATSLPNSDSAWAHIAPTRPTAKHRRLTTPPGLSVPGGVRIPSRCSVSARTQLEGTGAFAPPSQALAPGLRLERLNRDLRKIEVMTYDEGLDRFLQQVAIGAGGDGPLRPIRRHEALERRRNVVGLDR